MRLLGRERDLRLLGEVVARGAREAVAVVVTGDPGIGKTALLNAVEELAGDRGALVLRAVGVESEAQMPFAGLHQLLAPVLDAADGLMDMERDALLSAFGLFEGPRPDPMLIARAASDLLALVASSGPVVVLADDVQWFDPQSHEILAFIARRAAVERLTVIGVLRTGHPGPYLAAGLDEVRVGGVSENAAREILRAHAPALDAVARARVQAAALGNPLALLELPVVGVPGGLMPALSIRLEQAFAGRIAELPATARDAVLIAAVDSVNDLTEIVAATSVLSGARVDGGVLDPAAAVGMLRIEDRRVEFRHPLVRSGVLQFETVARRQAANAALAVVLADEPYRRVRHRAQSIIGPDDEVADELEANVAVALRRGAVMAAIGDLERSAELTTVSVRRGHRLLRAAEHAFDLGRADIVDRLIRLTAGLELTDLDMARREWLREIFEGTPGDTVRVLELCENAVQAAQSDDLDLSLDLLLGAAFRCWWGDAGARARERVVGVADTLPGPPGDPRVIAVLAIAEPVLRGRQVGALLTGIPPEAVTDADALRLLGFAAHAVGDTVRAADYLDRAEALIRAQGRFGLLPHILSVQVTVRLELGDWRRAADAAEEGLRICAETGQPIWNLGTLTCDARAHALRGDRDRALRLAARAEAEASRRRLNDFLACVQLARGYAWLSEGDGDLAYAALRPMFDPADPSFHHRERFAGVMFLAEAAVLARCEDDARSVIAELEEVAEATPAPILHVHLLYARAVLADEENLYLDALRADLGRWTWARARLQLAYGTWLNRRGRPDAAGVLRRARSALAAVGATGWRAMAEDELCRAEARRTAEMNVHRGDGQ